MDEISCVRLSDRKYARRNFNIVKLFQLDVHQNFSITCLLKRRNRFLEKLCLDWISKTNSFIPNYWSFRTIWDFIFSGLSEKSESSRCWRWIHSVCINDGIQFRFPLCVRSIETSFFKNTLSWCYASKGKWKSKFLQKPSFTHTVKSTKFVL